MKRTSIRSLRPGEPHPEGEPRRYTDPRGYTRLRWKLGPAAYVETYERDESGALTRTVSPQAKRVDYERATHLYNEGLSTVAVAAALGCDPATLSRGLRSRGVTMRAKRDYEDGFDPDRVLALYRQGHGVDDAARLAGTTYPRAEEVIRAAGLMRRRGRPKGLRSTAYETELRRQRPFVLKRAQHHCEARIDGVCSGRVDHIHHRRIRRQGGTNELSNLLAVCVPCHTYIHANPAESYAAGWLKKRTA